MTLDEAIELLCGVHTREDPDPQIGWTVEAPLLLLDPWERDYYVPAWEALRKHLQEARTRSAEASGKGK